MSEIKQQIHKINIEQHIKKFGLSEKINEEWNNFYFELLNEKYQGMAPNNFIVLIKLLKQSDYDMMCLIKTSYIFKSKI